MGPLPNVVGAPRVPPVCSCLVRCVALSGARGWGVPLSLVVSLVFVRCSAALAWESVLVSGRGLGPWPTIQPDSRRARHFSSSMRQLQYSPHQPPASAQPRSMSSYAVDTYVHVQQLAQQSPTRLGQHITPRWASDPASEKDVCALCGRRIYAVALSFSVLRPVQGSAIFELSSSRASRLCATYLLQTFYRQPSRHCAKRFFHHL